MANLPNRFGYSFKSNPLETTYIDCIEMKMNDGILYVDIGTEKKMIKMEDLDSFIFSLGHEAMIGIMLRTVKN